MEIKENLIDVLGSSCRSPKYLAEYCKLVALAYIKKKIKSGNSFILYLNSTIEDLAVDCIADLFERDAKGKYVVFESYFRDKDLSTLSETEVQMSLRRLIFSKVNDGLFRNFGIFDMSLSKIIRNLKIAANNQDLNTCRIDGNNHLYFKNSLSIDSHKPMMPPEFLEIKLTYRLNTKMDTPEILNQVQEIFQQQTQYQQRYPIVQIARIVRRSSIHLHDLPKTFVENKNWIVSKDKLDQLLCKSLKTCSECFKTSYVKKGKIDSETLNKYITCIKKILQHHYITDSEIGDSYYDHFHEIFPDIPKDDYRELHRQYLEYMVKQVRNELFLQVKMVV